jgi:hypothetical protein
MTTGHDDDARFDATLCRDLVIRCPTTNKTQEDDDDEVAT